MEGSMKIAPWHSLDQDVFHDNTGCEAGTGIARESRLKGTAKRDQCGTCAELGKTPNFTAPDAARTRQQFDNATQRGRGFDVRAGTPRQARRSGNR